MIIALFPFQNLYMNSYFYLQPLVVASIITGVWGMIMCVRILESVGLTPRSRFLVLQLVLIVVNLQCGIAKALPKIMTLPCIMSLHPSVVVHSKSTLYYYNNNDITTTLWRFGNSLYVCEYAKQECTLWRYLGRPMTSSGCFSAELMMMMIFNCLRVTMSDKIACNRQTDGTRSYQIIYSHYYQFWLECLIRVLRPMNRIHFSVRCRLQIVWLLNTFFLYFQWSKTS